MSGDYAVYRHEVQLKLLVASRPRKLWNVATIYLTCMEPPVDRQRGFAHVGEWQCASGSMGMYGKFARSTAGPVMMVWGLEHSPREHPFLWQLGDNVFTIQCFNDGDPPRVPTTQGRAFGLLGLPGNGGVPRPGSSGPLWIEDSQEATWRMDSEEWTRWEWRQSVRM
jgi:hypothetical protein